MNKMNTAVSDTGGVIVPTKSINYKINAGFLGYFSGSVQSSREGGGVILRYWYVPVQTCSSRVEIAYYIQSARKQQQ